MPETKLWKVYPMSHASSYLCIKHSFPELYAEISNQDVYSAYCENHTGEQLHVPATINGEKIAAFSGALYWGEIDDDESIDENNPASYKLIIDDSVKIIDDQAFARCEKLRVARLPIDSLRYIGQYAFQDCFNLREISLGDSLMGLGLSAFEGCTSLSYIRIPGTVKRIPMSCFSNCYNLRSIEVEEGVEEIDILAFCKCAESCHIELPSTITYIHDKAFFLTSVVLRVREGSYAHEWAIANKCAFELRD